MYRGETLTISDADFAILYWMLLGFTISIMFSIFLGGYLISFYFLHSYDRSKILWYPQNFELQISELLNV